MFASEAEACSADHSHLALYPYSPGVRYDGSDFLPQHFRVVEDAGAASIAVRLSIEEAMPFGVLAIWGHPFLNKYCVMIKQRSFLKTNWPLLSACHAGLLGDNRTPVGS